MADLLELERRVTALERKLRGTAQLNALAVSGPLTAASLTVAGEILTGLQGAWTPTFVGTTTAGIFTYSNQQGYYVKLGGIVFFWGRCTITAISGVTPPVGNMTIAGLPFACNATYFGSVLFGSVSQFNYTAAALGLLGLIGTGASVIQLRESFDNGAVVNVPAANFTVNPACDLVFGGNYRY